MTKRKPQIGDMADHKSGRLDPRPVAEVSADGQLVRLSINGYITDWLPARNYTFKE